MLQDVPTYLQRDFEIGPEEEVVFTQLTASEYSYRDAIRFKSGREILLQRLREGQRVKVLDLSSTEVVEPVREERPDQVFRRR